MALSDRPNLVMFMPDQLRADAVGCFGNPYASTPNIDALASQGVRFTNAFSQHSVCSPSRVSMMTGWYPHTRGHRTLTHLIQPHEPSLFATLKDAGYHVAWAGVRGDTFAAGVTEEVTDFSGFLVQPTVMGHADGDERIGLRKAFYRGRRDGDPTLDLDEANVQTAEQWLASNPPEPWVLFIALLFPHPPFEAEEPWFSMHDRSVMPPPIPPVADKPRYHEALRASYDIHDLTTEDWAEIQATYHGMVSRVDDQLGRVLRAVDAAGYGERTSTWFFTDHGEYLGDFGLVEKWPAGLDPCLVRNPLIVSAPGGAEGVVHDGMVEMIDLLPTMTELAGTETQHTHFGRSLVPVLDGRNEALRRFACSEGGFRVSDAPLFEVSKGDYERKTRPMHEDPATVGLATAIRSSTFTYIRRHYERDELYDRIADPEETTNLVDDPAHAGTLSTLRAEMLTWMTETSDVIPWTPDPRFARIPNGFRT